MRNPDGDWRDFMHNAAIRTVLWIALSLPYERRVPFMGWVVSRIVAPLARWDRRIAINLRHVRPDLPEDEVRRLQRTVPDNAGRALIESYSGAEFADRVGSTPLGGPGVAALNEARDAGRPTIMVTGHFGNYDVPRAAFFAAGRTTASLYRPMRNQRFNEHYVAAMASIGEPVFAADRKGLVGLVRHLANGGIIAVVTDVYVIGGTSLTFFGKPAPTAISAAEWALKYDAVMIPIYGIRQPDGLSFEIFLDDPIAHSTPEEMTQALNDSLEAQVRAHMDQWFWIHRRWEKHDPQGKRAAATIGP